jgi:ankyrin repeat protein
VPPTPPLFWAAQNGQAEAMKLLIAAGADPKFVAANGANLVIEAAHGGRIDALTLAVAAGPDVNAQDASGASALHVLAGGGNDADLPAMLALLRSHGARADLADHKGKTPAMLAASTLKEVKAAFVTAFQRHP